MSNEVETKISNLQSLMIHPGWKILQEELQQDIDATEEKLLGYKPLEENETIEQLQRERIDRVELKELPKHLIREISQSQGTDSEQYSAYDEEYSEPEKED